MHCFGLLIPLTISVVASAQPFLMVSDAVDAASNTKSIAPGSVFVVKGSFPLPTGLKTSSLPLQQTLNGVSVSLTPSAGGNAVRSWMLYTYADYVKGLLQVAAVLPSNTPAGDYKVSVTAGTSTAEGGKARVVEHKYRSFSNSQTGNGLAVIQNWVSAARLDRNMFAAGSLPDGQTKSPATPGQTVILWGVGLGAIAAADNSAPGVLDLRAQRSVGVAVGGIDAQVLYAGRSPQFPGVDQINFVVPQTAPTGCNVAVQVTVDGRASNPVTMAIASPGSEACEHPFLTREQLNALDRGEEFLAGEFNLMRYVEEVEQAGRMSFAEIHSAIGYFGAMNAGRASAIDELSVASGRCSLVSGDPFSSELFLDATAEDSEDCGMVTVSGPNLPDVRLTGDDDYYYRMFSARLEDGGTLLEGDAAHRLSPGTHRIRGAGGRAVGAFEAALEIPENLKWVNRSSVAEVRRDAGVEVTWTGARPQDRVIIQGGTMYVAGGTADWPDLEAVLFICAPPLGATSFTVPANILRSIPAGGDTKDSAGMVRVIAVTGASSTRFSASLPGGGQIGAGTVGYLSMITKAVPFR